MLFQRLKKNPKKPKIPFLLRQALRALVHILILQCLIALQLLIRQCWLAKFLEGREQGGEERCSPWHSEGASFTLPHRRAAGVNLGSRGAEGLFEHSCFSLGLPPGNGGAGSMVPEICCCCCCLLFCVKKYSENGLHI